MASDEGLDAWVAAHDSAAADSLRGGRLVGRAAAAFILPPAGALIGGIAAGAGETRRFAGMLAGLAIATLVSVVGSRMIGRPAKPTSEDPGNAPADKAEELR